MELKKQLEGNAITKFMKIQKDHQKIQSKKNKEFLSQMKEDYVNDIKEINKLPLEDVNLRQKASEKERRARRAKLRESVKVYAQQAK